MDRRELKKKALEQLVKQEYTAKIKDAVCKEMNKISSALLNEKNYDNIAYNISLLKIIAVREKETSLELLDNFLNRINSSSLELEYEKNSFYSRKEFLEIYNTKELSIKALEVLNHIKYLDVARVLRLLFKYFLNEHKKISDKINEILKNISEYNIHLLEKAGLVIHFSILEELKRLSPEDKVKYSSAISVLCGNLLSCETSGTSSNYDSFTFHRGSITASDNFKKIRSETMLVLKETYDLLSKSDLEDKTKRKLEIISSLERACWQDSQSSKNDEEYYKLFKLVLENAKEVVNFFISKIDSKEEYKILLSIDGDMARLHNRSIGINEDNTKNSEVIKTNYELLNLIEKFRDKLNQDKEFLIYRNLAYGDYLTSFCKDYYNGKNDIKEEITHYAKSINENNLNEWLDRIFYVIKTSGDGYPFEAFNLLEEIIRLDPNFGFRILQEREKEVSKLCKNSSENNIILTVLYVLVKEKNEEAKKQIISYLEQDKYFKECVLAIGYTKDDLDIELMNNALAKAKKEIELGRVGSDILLTFIRSVENYIKPFDKEQKKIVPKKIKDFLLSIIELLTLNKNGHLTDNIFYGSLITRLAESLDSEDEIQIILDNLLFDRKIDYRCEEILAQIANKHPDQVIEFFEKRLDLEAEDKSYDAIPYEFHNTNLKIELENNIKQLFAMVRRRFDNDSYLFEYKAAKIFKLVFTDFSEGFEKELIKLIKTEDKKDFDFVIRILRSYTELNEYGKIERLHNVCKEVIRSPLYDEGEELYTELAIILTSSGIMSGKYGFAEKYERKVKEIDEWKHDSNDKVRRFCTKFSESALKYAQKERERADEQEELRRHEYGGE